MTLPRAHGLEGESTPNDCALGKRIQGMLVQRVVGEGHGRGENSPDAKLVLFFFLWGQRPNLITGLKASGEHLINPAGPKKVSRTVTDQV